MGQEGHPGLDVYENQAFERRYWFVQRVSWGVFACFLIAGVLGLLGGTGPLVSATSQELESGLTVEYQRLIRKRSPVTLSVDIPAEETQASDVSLRIDREYLESYSIEDISPEPGDVYAADEYLVYSFQPADTAAGATITFRLQSQRMGILDGWISLDGQERVELRQFAYP